MVQISLRLLMVETIHGLGTYWPDWFSFLVGQLVWFGWILKPVRTIGRLGSAGYCSGVSFQMCGP